MDNRILSKVIAVMLVFTLTLANFVFLAVYARESYATSVDYEQQENFVDKTELSFDAYFIEEEKITHRYTSSSENNNLKLYLRIKVDKGYLKNATISIENSNFKLLESDKLLDDAIEKINTQTNTIVLNQINKGADRIIELPIKFVDEENYDVSNFSKDSNVTIKGTFINDKAKEINVNKTIIVNLALSEEPNAYLSSKVINNTIFEENNEKKRLIQLEIESKVEQNKLPIKETNIQVRAPKINEQIPEYISITSKTTEGTNGKSGNDFTTENYSIENDIIKINVKNVIDENNRISWKRNTTDKYIINLVYKLDECTDIDVEMDSKLILYNNENKELLTNYNEKLQLSEQTEKVILTEIESEEKISKGYMLVENANNTEYVEKLKLNIGYSEAVNSIKIEKAEEKYIDNEGNSYDAKIYYKNISIAKENFEKLLGTDGKITIINGTNKIGELTIDNLSLDFNEGDINSEKKDLSNLSQEDIDKISKMDISNMTQEEIINILTNSIGEMTNVVIETTKPISEGILNIEISKYIKSKEYSEEIIEKLNKINTKLNITSKNSTETVNREITLENPTYQISAEISQNRLATETENKNIELKVILENNNNTQRLYKNPVVEIELPEYIEEINVNSVDLFYDTEITPEVAKIKTNEEGCKILELSMKGQQTKFNNNESIKGLTLIANINLKTKETTPNISEKIKIKAISDGNEVANTEKTIKYIVPSEMVTINGMTNYNDKNETTTSTNNENEEGTIDRNTEAKIATETITIMNNNDYKCGNIKILGRTPSEGNRDMVTGEEIGSTFTAKVASKIRVVSGIDESKITVYYSTNSEATEDVELETNNWQTEIKKLEEIKSYLILIDGEMSTGDIMKFEYDVEIPEGLEKQESTYSMFKVFYTNLDEKLQGQEESTTSPTVGVSTGNENDINVVLEAEIADGEKEGTVVLDGTETLEESIVKYTVNIKNNTTKQINNAVLYVDIPEGTIYTTHSYTEDTNSYVYDIDSDVKTYTKELKTLEPGESIQEEFYLTMTYISDKPEKPDVDKIVAEIVKREDFNSDEEYQTAWDFFTKLYSGDKETVEQYAQQVIKRENFDSDEEYEIALKEFKDQYLEYGVSEEEEKIEFSITAKIEMGKDTGTYINSNTLNNVIVGRGMELSLDYDNVDGERIEPGGKIEYNIIAFKGKEFSYKNVEIQCVLPDGLNFDSSIYNDEFDESSLEQIYDQETIEEMKKLGIDFQSEYNDETTIEQNGRTITWKIKEMKKDKEITLICNIESLKKNENEREHPLKVTMKYDGMTEEISSNVINFTIGKPTLKITHESTNKTSEITEDDEIEYIYTIENTSKYDAYNVSLTDYCSDGLILGSIKYREEGSNFEFYISQGGNINEEKIDIDAGEKIYFTVKGKANYLRNNASGIIEHYFTVKTDYQDLMSSKITHNVKAKEYTFEDGNTTVNKHLISGVAWVDSNADGEKTSDEEILPDIQVLLIDEEGKVIRTQNTGERGEYSFNDLAEGKYVIAFTYDNKKYDITTYKKNGTNTNKAKEMTLNINGVNTKCAATDTIDLKENTYNINLGLVINEKFDLSLSKTISKVTIKTKGKTITKSYNNSKLEKIEIKSKEMEGATVAIEYTITVRNEGAIPGYANKIVDYLKDTDLKFNSELNSKWYLGTDGNLYNADLSSKIINPGEEVNVKLVLTKAMTDKNTGITNNTAELYETYNKEGKEDYDSIPANKVQNEDDMGIAEIIITVKTGQVTYIVLAILILVVICGGAYLIKKKVINW